MQTPDPSALNVFVSQAQEIRIAGKVILLRPLTVGQLPGFLHAAQPIITELQSGDIAQALLRNPAAVIESVTIACNQVQGSPHPHAFFIKINRKHFALYIGFTPWRFFHVYTTP